MKTKDVKEKTKTFLIDRKKSNNIVDIAVLAEESDDRRVLMSCIQAFHKIFTHLLREKALYTGNWPLTDSSREGGCGPYEQLVIRHQKLHLLYLQDAMSYSMTNLTEKVIDCALTTHDEYKAWLRDRYDDAVTRLLELLSHDVTHVQELSLCTLMRCLKVEGETSFVVRVKGDNSPHHIVQGLCSRLLSHDHDMSSLIGRFQEYLQFDDMRYSFLKVVNTLNKAAEKQPVSEVYLSNLFSVLSGITFPESTHKRLNNFCPNARKSSTVSSLHEHRTLYSYIWLKFLANKLPTSLYKRVLVIMHDKVMPYMINPLLLSDFLTDSYNVGGAVSLLALNGLFMLIYKYNLDYPDFYTKLYALLDPGVFHLKYRARFFFLADLFLTSSHLPAYIIAAFAKKLSRLSLVAPPAGLCIIVPFIYNLINRHPTCRVLIDRPEGPSELADDPYDAQEPEPLKCHALDSSLWEIKSLQRHYHPEVSRFTNRLEHPLDKVEIQMEGKYELTYEDMFERQCKRNTTDVPVTFHVPTGLLSHKDDRMKLCWTLQ